MNRIQPTIFFLGLLVACAGLLLGGCKEAPLTFLSIDFESSHEDELLQVLDEVTVTLDPDRELVDADNNPYSATTVSDGFALADADFDGILELSMTVSADQGLFTALPTLGLEVEEANTPLPFTLVAEGFASGELAALSPATEKLVLDEGEQMLVTIVAFDLLQEPAPQCDDGEDNDGDGWVDLDDMGCEDQLDDSEEDDGSTECSDGVDNDGDTLIDAEDPDCVDGFDEAEADYPECGDQQDNDGDGWTDFDDLGCEGSEDDDETDDGSTECSDGVDNDGDTQIDVDDPECDNGWDDNEDETTECEDGADNDADGWADLDDPGCDHDPSLNDEGGFDPSYECNDGIDNDEDGYIDSDDSDCADGWGDDEGVYVAHCANGMDDDADGWIDLDDPGCDADPDGTDEGGLNPAYE